MKNIHTSSYIKPSLNGVVDCDHCWHPFTGAIMIVLHNGEMVEECCKCHTHRTVHVAHR